MCISHKLLRVIVFDLVIWITFTLFDINFHILKQLSHKLYSHQLFTHTYLKWKLVQANITQKIKK